MKKENWEFLTSLIFLQLISGIIVPVYGLFPNDKIPVSACIAALLPALLTIVVLYLNYYKKYESAFIAYFIVTSFSHLCYLYQWSKPRC